MNTDGSWDATATLGVVFLIALLIPAIFFLLAQHKTLVAIKKSNRRLAPGLVWLQLIPALGQIWQFFVVSLIADSIRKEFESREEDSIVGLDLHTVEQLGKRPTLSIGIVYCTLNVAMIFFNLFTDPAETSRSLFVLIPLLLAFSSVTCWIIYWVQLAGMKRKIQLQ